MTGEGIGGGVEEGNGRIMEEGNGRVVEEGNGRVVEEGNGRVVEGGIKGVKAEVLSERVTGQGKRSIKGFTVR